MNIKIVAVSFISNADLLISSFNILGQKILKTTANSKTKNGWMLDKDSTKVTL